MKHGDKPWSRCVAANMRRFRRERGWDQAEFGAKLGGWSATSVSAAERSAESKRVKVFDIDEVILIAEVLGVAVTDLITPPPKPPPCPCCHDEPPAGMICQNCGAEGESFSSQEPGT